MPSALLAANGAWLALGPRLAEAFDGVAAVRGVEGDQELFQPAFLAMLSNLIKCEQAEILGSPTQGPSSFSQFFVV